MHTDSSYVARFPAVRRPEIAGPRNRLESELSNRIRGPVTCALGERRPRPLSFSFNSRERQSPSPNNEKEERQNRRAACHGVAQRANPDGTSAGEKSASDECSHSERAGFLPVAGDPIACRSADRKRKRPNESLTAPLRLCAFAGWVAGWALRSSRFNGSRVGLEGPASSGLLEIWTGREICVDLRDLRFRFRQAGPVFSVPLWFFRPADIASRSQAPTTGRGER